MCPSAPSTLPRREQITSAARDAMQSPSEGSSAGRHARVSRTSKPPATAATMQQLKALATLAGLAFVCCVLADVTASPMLSSESGESLEAASPNSTHSDLASSNNLFGLELYKALARNASGGGGNVVVSPLSVATALALVWMGAEGETARQLASALHLPLDRQRVAEGYKALGASLRSSDGMVIRMANKMFVTENFPIKESFQRTAVDFFGSDTQQVNFQTANEDARQIINRWAEEATDGKIKNMFQEGSLDKESVVILANAIYFKGEWLSAFKENETREEPFYTTAHPHSSVQVPMMNAVMQARYTRISKLNCSIMELPYKGSMRMLVILPHQIDGLNQLEDKINQINFNDLSLYPAELKIKFPKFKIEAELSLKEKLQQLHVLDLFERQANLSQLSDAPNILVSKVLQKTFIEVNEKGTEASVVTAVDFISRSGRIEREFYMNRPFLFLIQGADGNIIFMGRVNNPTSV